MKGQRISFSGQVRNYQTTVQQVVSVLGGEAQAADYLKKCIYSVGIGSNDYLNNYFMPTFYSSSRQFTPEQFANDLISRYSTQLTVRFSNMATLSISAFVSVDTSFLALLVTSLFHKFPFGVCVGTIQLWG